MPDLASTLGILAERKTLTSQQSADAFDAIMSGNVDPLQISAFLTALRVRGETVDEILGGAVAMREKADMIDAPAHSIDIVGTGGSGLDTFNVSTATCFVVAAAGIPVAKHGNRAASSKSGSADVLERLGGNLDIGFHKVQQALADTGFTFLYARAHHQAMRHVVPVRAALKFKTIFNLLGPLSNPAQTKIQLLGVFDKKWVRPMADTLAKLGSTRALVVHASDGMDEITLSGTTHVAELKGGVVTEYDLSPADMGLPVIPLEDLLGGDIEYNANAITRLLDGVRSPFRDIVTANAGAALMLAGKADTLREGVLLAADIIDKGQAKQCLTAWAAFTQECSA